MISPINLITDNSAYQSMHIRQHYCTEASTNPIYEYIISKYADLSPIIKNTSLEYLVYDPGGIYLSDIDTRCQIHIFDCNLQHLDLLLGTIKELRIDNIQTWYRIYTRYYNICFSAEELKETRKWINKNTAKIFRWYVEYEEYWENKHVK